MWRVWRAVKDLIEARWERLKHIFGLRCVAFLSEAMSVGSRYRESVPSESQRRKYFISSVTFNSHQKNHVLNIVWCYSTDIRINNKVYHQLNISISTWIAIRQQNYPIQVINNTEASSKVQRLISHSTNRSKTILRNAGYAWKSTKLKCLGWLIETTADGKENASVILGVHPSSRRLYSWTGGNGWENIQSLAQDILASVKKKICNWFTTRSEHHLMLMMCCMNCNCYTTLRSYIQKKCIKFCRLIFYKFHQSFNKFQRMVKKAKKDNSKKATKRRSWSGIAG